MKILVVAATIEEIKPSLAFLEDNRITSLITGVGMVATTYALTKHLQQQKPDLLLQVGVGGILDRSANLGEVYRIYTDEIYGLGANDQGSFIPIEDLGFGKRIYCENPPPHIQLPAVHKAQGITVNNVHGATENIVQLKQQYQQSLMESMEGAAAFFVAEQEATHCLQFRAVSNYIEPRNRATWEIGLAVNNLNVFLQQYLRFLIQAC